MPNPFVYGEVAPASSFADRATELGRLVADLAAGQKVFLISPRRYGKSSLVRQAFAQLATQRIATLEFTITSFSSYVGFLEGYARALVTLETRTPPARSWLRDLFTTTTPELRVGAAADGGFAIGFPAVRTPREAARLADQVFALPARIAERLGRPVAIALDEFQGIGAFDGGGGVEQALRAAVQHQRRVGYVFAGSEPTLMEQMISPRRPFFKAGPVMRLQKIPPDLFADFLEDRFRRSGLKPVEGLGLAIVDLAGNLPYDVQRLAHETWDDAWAMKKRRVGLDDLHATLHRLLAEHEPMFEALWQRLTLAQRAALRVVVFEQGRGLLSADTRSRHRLGGASTVQAALAALVREDLVARDETGRYVVIDSLMREWVARNTY
jgi:hypothetical protein